MPGVGSDALQFNIRLSCWQPGGLSLFSLFEPSSNASLPVIYHKSRRMPVFASSVKGKVESVCRLRLQTFGAL
jgi:hypothetical protein